MVFWCVCVCGFTTDSKIHIQKINGFILMVVCLVGFMAYQPLIYTEVC